MSLVSVKSLIFIILMIVGLGAFYFISVNKDYQYVAPEKTEPVVEEKVKYPQDYTIVMIGDSMTEVLGNSTELKQFLGEYYKGKTFEVLNYGFGATNLLSVMDRITSETEHTRKFRAIRELAYDLVLIESFGQNPLSHLGLAEGLKKQEEELTRIVGELKKTNPYGKIVFVATISPNKEIFAKNQVALTAEKRAEWVNERVSYIQNHIKFATLNNIPVINIYKASLMENGDGNPDYINTTDYIHPSPTGIVFISKQIADFIYNNKVL